MNPEMFNVTWPSYTDHLKELLHNIWNSKELTDVTIFCEDKKQFNAHKVVLSACSSVFKSIIHETNMSNQVIYLRGIHSNEMESILRFIYLGETTFYPDRIEEFLNVAKILEIKEVSKDTVEVDNKSQDNVVAETETIQIRTSRAIETYAKEEEQGDLQVEQKYILNKHTEEMNYIQMKPKEEKKNITFKPDPDGLNYTCDDCPRKFKAKYNLVKH